MVVRELIVPMVHIRFQGQTMQIEMTRLDVTPHMDDNTIKQTLAYYLDVPVSKFQAYVIERHENGNMTIRPEAVFG